MAAADSLEGSSHWEVIVNEMFGVNPLHLEAGCGAQGREHSARWEKGVAFHHSSATQHLPELWPVSSSPRVWVRFPILFHIPFQFTYFLCFLFIICLPSMACSR